MNNEHKIEFQISGVGDIRIRANSRKEALEQFAEMEMRELAGYCTFSDFELPSGIHIIRIDDDEFQADLNEVEAQLEKEEEESEA